ncbi:MAG: PEP-CTERM sorting domain-containing protein [Propionivibrio sp.]
MKPTTALKRSLLAAALICGATASHASLISYTNQANFLAAVSAPATDTFNDLPFPLNVVASPLARSVGAYGYTATAGGGFYSAGTLADVWLSTNTATATITFNNFSGGVFGIGGLFFASNLQGAFQSGQSITVAATDSDGTLTQIITNALQSNFLGFVSNGPLTSLTVTAAQPAGGFAWPTVNDLTLAALPMTVPEPQSGALLIAGLGILGLIARRRPRLAVRCCKACL